MTGRDRNQDGFGVIGGLIALLAAGVLLIGSQHAYGAITTWAHNQAAQDDLSTAIYDQAEQLTSTDTFAGPATANTSMSPTQLTWVSYQPSQPLPAPTGKTTVYEAVGGTSTQPALYLATVTPNRTVWWVEDNAGRVTYDENKGDTDLTIPAITGTSWGSPSHD